MAWMEPHHKPRAPSADGMGDNECVAEPTNVATGCWNEYGTEEHARLAAAMDAPGASEVARMYLLLAYWAKRGRSKGGASYLARFVALAAEKERFNLAEQKGFDEARRMPLWELKKQLETSDYIARDEL